MSDYVEQYIHANHVVRIVYDSDPESPRDWCNTGRMVCWHSRYNLGDRDRNDRDPSAADGTTFETPQDFMEWWKENGEGGVLLGLSLLDHSGLRMYAGHGPAAGDAAGWDSGPVGWIYATREAIRETFMVEEITDEISKRAEDNLRAEIETYDDFLSGQVYGYMIFEIDESDEEFDPDDLDDTGHIDRCWGFYGLDDCRESANEAAEHAEESRQEAVSIYRL